MLRIIAGKYRSLRIDSPDANITRPTQDRVREAIMSALYEQMENARVLDLFAGSGALGIEALSRGASFCFFCDHSKKAIQVIKKNLNKIKEDHAKLFFGDYEKALEQLYKEKEKFDIVFLDPPYRLKDAYKKSRELLIKYNLLSDKAILIEESNEKLQGNYGQSKDYQYGIVHVRITREVVL